MKKNYLITLSGGGALHFCQVKIEGIIIAWDEITDGRKKWICEDIEVNVDSVLDVWMTCSAISGTGWQLTVTDKSNGAVILKKEGFTGRNGNMPNNSEEKFETEIGS